MKEIRITDQMMLTVNWKWVVRLRSGRYEGNYRENGVFYSFGPFDSPSDAYHAVLADRSVKGFQENITTSMP
jgi:hypothetical protein